MKSNAAARLARRKIAASLLAAAFVLLSASPAMPASAGSVAGTAAASATAAGASGSSFSSSPSAPLSSASIADDVYDAPARMLPGGASYDRFGSVVASLGDLNADGTSELGVVSRSPTAVTVIVGTRGQVAGGTLVVLRPASGGEIFGLALGGGGDLNGDGFDDFAVTASQPSANGAPTREVHVYWGQAAVTRSLPRTTLAAPALNTTFGQGVQIVGDVDGDGFDDLVVSAARGVSPGAVFLYRGGATGVSQTPSWSYTAGSTDDAFGAAVFSTGDLSGDGLSDFIVTTGGDAGADGFARIYQFFGDATGSPQGPLESVGDQRDDGYGTSVAGGDFNGDTFGDLLIGSPEFDTSAESLDAGRVLEYHGSALGLLGSPVVHAGAAGSHYSTSVANAGDLSGDGIDDAAVGAPMASADGPFTNGQMFVYFGGPSGLATQYDMSEAGEAGYDLYGAAIASRADLDDDNRDDLVLCAPGRDITGAVDAGACYMYSGLRIRLPALLQAAWTAPDLTGGVALARAPTPYHFALTFVHRGPASHLAFAEQAFLSGALDGGVAVRYDGASGAIGIGADAGGAVPPAAFAELRPDSAYSSGSTFVHSFRLVASLTFAWGVVDPDPLHVRITVRDERGGESTATLAGVLPVVAALEFRTSPAAELLDGTPLPAGSFVRAGEPLRWTGGALAYRGTTIAPPASEVALFLVDAAGAEARASYDGATGDIFAEQAASSEDAAADPHRVEARTLGGTTLASRTATVAVDALAPTFGSPTPEDGSVVTQSTYPVSIPVSDAGSGVDGARVEFSVSHSDPPAFSLWQPAATRGGRDATATATVALEEGAPNFIRFRAYDAVGNGPAYADPIQVRLDYGAVEFSLASPAAGAWIRDATPTLTFEVRKAADPAIDLGTVEVQANGGPWRSAGLAGPAFSARFSADVALQEGAGNELRVRARVVGHDAVYLSAPFTVQVDTELPAIDVVAPSAGTWATEGQAESIARVTDASSGVHRTSLRYRYLVPGMSEWSAWGQADTAAVAGGFEARALIPVQDGLENFVVWQAQDVAGNGPATSVYQRLLADSKPVGFSNPSPADGARVEGLSRLSILVDDADGSGVDLSTVEYRVGLPTGLSTGWQNAGRSGVATRATVSVAFTLPEGPSSVQWRARDAAGTPVTESPASRITVAPPVPEAHAPTLVLTSPVAGAHYPAGREVRFDASRSHAFGSAPIFFQWSIDGEPQAGHTPAFWAQLPPGTHIVTLVVSDGTQSPDITISFTVDPPVSPPGPFGSVAEQALLVSFALLISGAVAARLWSNRARRALRL